MKSLLDYMNGSIEDESEDRDIIGLDEVGDSFFQLEFPCSDRPYQNKAVEDIWDAYDQGYQSPLLVAPTGSGKTRVASMVINEATKGRGWRTAFVVDRLLLLYQAKREFEAAGIRCGLIVAGESTDLAAPVQLISKDTLLARYVSKGGDYLVHNCHLGEFHLIVFDECHRATNHSHATLRRIFPQAKVLGLTATPILPSGKLLGIPHFDKMIVAAMPSELLADGYILPGNCWAPDLPDLNDLNNVRPGSDYNKLKAARLMTKDNMVGSTIRHWKELSNEKSTLVFCVNRTHAKWNKAQYERASIKSAYVGCETSPEERRDIFAAFTAGDIKCLHNAELLTEGVDFPFVECIQIIKPTKSLRLVLQIQGRPMRNHRFPDGRIKTDYTLIDHAGVCLAHCLPGTDIDWALGSMSPEKMLEQQKNEKPGLKNRVCPKCRCIHPCNRPNCPQCGHLFRDTVGVEEIEQRPGKLKKIDGDMLPPNATPEEVEARKYKQYRIQWIKAIRLAGSRNQPWSMAQKYFMNWTGGTKPHAVGMRPLPIANDWTKIVPRDQKL